MKRLRQPEIDRRRGAHVAALAESLAIQSKHLHGLPKTWTRPLRATAWLTGSGASRHLSSRRGQKLYRRVSESFSVSQARVVLLALGLVERGRRRVIPSLPGSKRQAAESVAARIAAIVRIANALCPHGSQPPRIATVRDEDGLVIEISGGPGVERCVERAMRKTALWNRLALRRVTAIRVVPKPSQETRRGRVDEPMAEAGRRILLRQLQQMVSRQYGLAYVDDVEFVHEMRVAIRRFRAAARVFRKAIEGAMESSTRQLRELADVLGEARDADVFMGFLHDYRKNRGAAHQVPLEALIKAQQRRRARLYRQTRRVCQAPKQQKMLAALLAQLAAPLNSPRGLRATAKGRGRTAQRGARKSLRRTMKAVVQFGPRFSALSDERQHKLRIACKKLRYTAEFFAELYPPRLLELLRPVVQLQDLLGASHDAEVYLQRLKAHFKDTASGKRSLRAWEALRRHLRRSRRDSLSEAAELWKKLLHPRSQREFQTLLQSPREPVAAPQRTAGRP